MRLLRHPKITRVSLQDLLYALADPVRMQIVLKLAAQGSCSCAEAGPQPGLSKSTLSFHFDILRERGLVRSAKAGKQYVNTLRLEELNQRFPGVLEAILSAANRSQRKPGRTASKGCV